MGHFSSSVEKMTSFMNPESKIELVTHLYFAVNWLLGCVDWPGLTKVKGEQYFWLTVWHIFRMQEKKGVTQKMRLTSIKRKKTLPSHPVWVLAWWGRPGWRPKSTKPSEPETSHWLETDQRRKQRLDRRERRGLETIRLLCLRLVSYTLTRNPTCKTRQQR